MIYDLEETDPVDEVLDNLMETGEKFTVTTQDNAVQIRLSTNSGQILVKRFIFDNRVELKVG